MVNNHLDLRTQLKPQESDPRLSASIRGSSFPISSLPLITNHSALTTYPHDLPTPNRSLPTHHGRRLFPQRLVITFISSPPAKSPPNLPITTFFTKFLNKQKTTSGLNHRTLWMCLPTPAGDSLSKSWFLSRLQWERALPVIRRSGRYFRIAVPFCYFSSARIGCG